MQQETQKTNDISSKVIPFLLFLTYTPYIESPPPPQLTTPHSTDTPHTKYYCSPRTFRTSSWCTLWGERTTARTFRSSSGGALPFPFLLLGTPPRSPLPLPVLRPVQKGELSER